MFESSPGTTPPSPQPNTPTVPPAPLTPGATPGQPPVSHIPPLTPLKTPTTQFSTVAQSDLAANDTDLFKREGLSVVQKIILVVLTLVVVGALIGGGFWLYLKIQPGAAARQTNTNISNTTQTNQNTGLEDLAKDQDKDGLRDSDETQHGTNPLKVDTDGDGLGDGDEVKTHHTNPTLADTDADQLDDLSEVITYKTDPFKQDTDGDTYLDGDEVIHGYDPNGLGKLAQ